MIEAISHATTSTQLHTFAHRNKPLVVFVAGLQALLLLGLVVSTVLALQGTTQRPAIQAQAGPWASSPPAHAAGESSTQAVTKVLDELHDAASKADGQRYFTLFAPDAVFLGTDATERWPINEFRTYAQARFDTGTGWTYRLKDGKRFITIDKGGKVAWFDELLENAKYGTCRGSGVLQKIDGPPGDEVWRITQYNLTLTVPNEKASQVVALIKGE